MKLALNHQSFAKIAFALLCGAPFAGAQTVERLYSFPEDDSNGSVPSVSLTVGPDGALYGTTTRGGTNGNGTVFRMTTSGQFTSLANFDMATTGRYPVTKLLNIGDGLLYGVTEENGRINGQPEGTIYSVSPTSGANVVRNLPARPAALTYPIGLLSPEPGVFTVLTGSLNAGGLWHVPTNTAQAITSTVFGGATGDHFTNPILASDGFIYAVAAGTNPLFAAPAPGTIIRVRPDGTQLAVLHNCVNATGVSPSGGLVEATDGNFYGTMSAGGTSGDGCVFRLTPSGQYSVIYNFSQTSPSGVYKPIGDLIQATDGFLYGVTGVGYGDIFKVSLNGVMTKVREFDFSNIGAYPKAGLIQASDGFLYGTTTGGGADRNGTIYRVKLPAPPPNLSPIARNDTAFTTGVSGAAVNIPVLANDTDPENGKLTLSIQTAPESGTAVIDGTGKIITYTPVGNLAGGDTFTYRITDPLGKSATATVEVVVGEPAPAPLPGLYNGVMSSDALGLRGQLLVRLTATGNLTGTLVFNGKRAAIKTKVVDGTAVARVAIAGKLKSSVVLSYDRVRGRGINAMVNGPETWEGSLLPTLVDTTKPALPPALYTFAVRRADISRVGTATPVADGFGTAKHTPKTGSFRCVGKMPDGSPLSWSSTIVYEAELARAAGGPTTSIPVYSNPVKGGVVGGNVSRDSVERIFWQRPAANKSGAPYEFGFNSQITVDFRRFVPPGDLTGLADFSQQSTLVTGTASGASVEASFTVEQRKVVFSSPLRAFSINRKTGAFTGKIDGPTKVLPFAGVFLGGGETAAHMIVNGESDTMAITP